MPGSIGSSQRGGYAEKASQMLGAAAQTFSQQDRVVKPAEPEKTAGGAISSAGSMALSGAMIGSAGGPVGTVIGGVVGGVVGLAGYMFS